MVQLKSKVARRSPRHFFMPLSGALRLPRRQHEQPFSLMGAFFFVGGSIKNTYYFPHDYHARHDPKLEKLFLILGYGGLGIYWCLIEMLYEQGGYLSLKDLLLYSQNDKDLCERITKVINDYGLFEKDNSKLWSKACLDRLAFITEKSGKASKSALRRWFPDANPMPTQCGGNAIKEKKVKESILKDKTTNPKPLLDYFVLKYKEKTTKDYVMNWAKDQKILKDLLKILSEVELKARINQFFEGKDEWREKAGYTVGVFRSQINKLGEKKSDGIWSATLK